MSAIASQPLTYRDGVDDALVARHHTRQFIATWIATPAVVLLAFVGVLFYFAGTMLAVWATAQSVGSLPSAALWMLASLATFLTGNGIMLLADWIERTFV
jgi:hypothetical protein